MKTTFTFKRVTYNGVKGWFATRCVGHMYAGTQFGKTRKAAQAKFD